MSNAIKVVQSLPPNHLWSLPQQCKRCGNKITRPPYITAKKTGGRSTTVYYHIGCYPRDSRPSEKFLRSLWAGKQKTEEEEMQQRP